MHPYSIDSEERQLIYLILAGVAIIVTYGLNVIFQKFHLVFPWYIETPSVMSIYGLLCLWFTKSLWKLNFLHKVGLIKTPDISGQWKGTIQTSYDNHANKFDVEMEIKQDWTHIQICWKSQNSKSKSLNASITIKDGTTLTYDYFSEPNPGAVETMCIHRGTAILDLIQKNTFEGEYYSGRGRQNIGSLRFTK